MAYNRWLSTEYLAHHGVKGQKWGERNGPPYPLDSSISTGSKLIKGDGSPQGKKKYKTSEKTAHKRAERKARTGDKDTENAKIKDARDNDMHELDFLEYVQNEDWYEKGDKKRMLKEYSEYLNDRDKYSQKGFTDEEKIASAKLEADRMLPHDNSLSAKIRKKSLFNSDGTLNAKGRKYYHVSGDGTLSFDELELRQKSTEERPYMKSFKEYITKKEGLDTTGLSKKTKAAKEKELLRLWYKDRTTNREDAIQDTLHARIADKSGSWYFGEAKTENFRKALEEERFYRQEFVQNTGGFAKDQLKRARRNLARAVLIDLGYEVNNDNLRLVEGWIIDD